MAENNSFEQNEGSITMDNVQCNSNNNESYEVQLKDNFKVKGGKCYAFFKRAFDFCASFCAIVVLSIPMLIVALIVKLGSKGPIIYKSTRVAMNGRHFTMYKFRSMYEDAEDRLKELTDKNEVKDGVIFKMKDDPRITPVGKFIRKTSIDELPQLFNILKGDMSIVGPRAALPNEVAKYDERALKRLTVPQGLTGEWQTHGRSDTSFTEMINLDLEYIQNKRSFWYDIKLIFLTVKVVLTGKGAR